jgi:Methyltransferase domain
MGVVACRDRPELNASEFAPYVRAGGFDFVDFGCSNGDSIRLGKSRFGGTRGLGIDIDEKKVKACRDAGLDAVIFDIMAIPNEKLFRFAILSHFLEHIRDPLNVASYLRKACSISTAFVYIQQPYFDADAYLARHDFKLYWSDWHGHPNHMSALDLRNLLREIQDSGFAISFSVYARGLITSSEDPSVHGQLSPRDQHQYDPTVHPPKKQMVFTEPVYKDLVSLITLDSDHTKLLKAFGLNRYTHLFSDYAKGRQSLKWRLLSPL